MAKSPWDEVTVWHELMSVNTEQARKFYEEVLGLTTASLDGAPFPYTIWQQDGAPVGG
jgi:predicted enzyme related to lactoylglutathione lyase